MERKKESGVRDRYGEKGEEVVWSDLSPGKFEIRLHTSEFERDGVDCA